MSGRSRHSTNGRPGYVLCSNPVNAGRSLYNSKPSIEEPQRNSPTRRCNPEIPGAIADLARESATEVPRSPPGCPGTIRRAGAAPHRVGATSALGVPDTRSSTNWGPAGRVSGYVPKSPCATSVNPGLGRAKSLQTRIVRRRRTSLRRSTWPRLRTRARNLERGRETARSCGISPICGCNQSQRSRHLTQAFPDVPHDRRGTVQRGGRNACGHEPRAPVRDEAPVLAHWQGRISRSSREPVINRSRRGAVARERRGQGGWAEASWFQAHSSGRPRLLERAAVGAASCLDDYRE